MELNILKFIISILLNTGPCVAFICHNEFCIKLKATILSTKYLVLSYFTLSPLLRASPSIKRLRNESPLGEAIPRFLSLFKGQMSSKMQFQLVNHLFKLMIEQKHGLPFLHFLHGDCMEVVTNGILALHKAGKRKHCIPIGSRFC